MKLKPWLIVIAALAVAACSPPAPVEETAVERVNDIARDFVGAYYAQYPEEIYEVGYPEPSPDHFGDHGEESLAAWNASIDDWIMALGDIDTAQLEGKAEAVTYAFARERLQALADLRICKNERWNISPTWTGWQYMFASTLAVQPVESDADRQAALRRLADIPRYLETKIDNLRRGQASGHTAAKSSVAAVLGKTITLIDTPTEESPFFSPATRSDDGDFINAYRDIYETRFLPAMARYRDYLENEYRGRDDIGVGANTDGHACYSASVRYWSSISMDPMDIHRAGLAQMKRIQEEMLEIARTSFGTDDVKALLEELRTSPEYTFTSEAAMLEYIGAAVARAKAEVGDWFAYVPDTEMVIRAAPAYDQDSGGGFYAAGSADGSRPGTYLVGTYNPTSISRADQEATAFHEGYPGHHLQGSVALSNEALHPILRFMYVAGSGEGWALYTERLSDEMGLYSDDVARLGMLSNEAFRAARLVVDPGIHVLGWTRQQAIDYMLAHTASSLGGITSEIDRYAAVPGQATSYMLGSLEIQRLRQHAEAELGGDFDIRQFHNHILINGGVTLPMLATEIENWIFATKAGVQ